MNKDSSCMYGLTLTPQLEAILLYSIRYGLDSGVLQRNTVSEYIAPRVCYLSSETLKKAYREIQEQDGYEHLYEEVSRELEKRNNWTATYRRY